MLPTRNHSPSLREASPDSLEWLDFERRGRPTARLSSRPPSLSRTVSPHTPANLRPHCCPRSERVRPPSPSLHTSHIRPRSRSTLRNILSAPTDSRSRTSRSPSLSSVPRVTLPPPSAYIRRGSFDRTVLPPSRASPISAPRVNLPPPTAFPSTFNLPPPSSFPSSSRRRSSSSGSSIRRRLSALQAMD